MIGGVSLKSSNDGFYYDDKGRPFVRVSTVLKEFGFTDDRFFDEDSRLRGQAAHLAVKYRLKGTLDDASLDPLIEPRVAAFDQFVFDTGFKAELFETTVHDPQFRFAGTLDLLGHIRNLRVLIDIKTGIPQKAARLQTGAYAFCVDDRLLRRYCLELKDDGTYNLSPPYEDRSDGGVFAGLAAAYWFKHNNGMLKKALAIR